MTRSIGPIRGATTLLEEGLGLIHRKLSYQRSGTPLSLKSALV